MSFAELLELDPRTLAPASLRPVEVAVLDTGVDATHPDLRERVVDAFELIRSGPRFRAIRRPVPSANDPIGHGTGIASTIASLAPNARIVDVRVASADKTGSGEAVLAGLRLAIERGSPLLNVSLACHPRLLQPLTELCEAAYFRNQTLVAARRNLPLADHGLPAQLAAVIGVDAAPAPNPFELVFREGNPIEFSAHGDDFVVAAPGGRYTVQGGTSFATSAVTALCALLLGRRADLTPYELKALLKQRALRRPSGS
jgi:subtilisin family serine protease